MKYHAHARHLDLPRYRLVSGGGGFNCGGGYSGGAGADGGGNGQGGGDGGSHVDAAFLNTVLFSGVRSGNGAVTITEPNAQVPELSSWLMGLSAMALLAGLRLKGHRAPRNRR